MSNFQKHFINWANNIELEIVKKDFEVDIYYQLLVLDIQVSQLEHFKTLSRALKSLIY